MLLGLYKLRTCWTDDSHCLFHFSSLAVHLVEVVSNSVMTAPNLSLYSLHTLFMELSASSWTGVNLPVLKCSDLEEAVRSTAMSAILNSLIGCPSWLRPG